MKIAVNGAAGTMGRRLIGAIIQADDCELVAALECAGHPRLGQDAGKLAGVGKLGVAMSSELDGGPDVLIDFSLPEGTMLRARECAERRVAMVIGTTGLSEEQRASIEADTATRVPVLVAPNMSVGVNLLFCLAELAAGALPAGYDVEIVESHHRRKVDAPSGTALELARRLCGALGRSEDVLLHGRQGRVGRRTAEEIAIHAVRAGDIVGEHTVLFATEGERIELTHRASSRDVFARGALEAARFLLGKPPRLYSMADVLA